MRSLIAFSLLATVRAFSRLFYRREMEWVGEVPASLSRDVRVIAIMNHTSLYEPLLAGLASYALVWKVARHGVMPVAEKTMKRRIGLFFKFLMRHVVVVTRQRDHTWDDVLNHVDAEAVVTLTPEGRMKRPNGLDSTGQPMTVRGGIADILAVVQQGKMLVVYSGGLHHIQAPGERLPRLFKTIRVRLEMLDIPTYRDQLMAESGGEGFKVAVIRDLERRRDTHCPTPERLDGGGAGAART